MTEGLRCKDCGAPVDRSIQFCTACGAYLGWAEQETPAAAGEAEVDTAPVAVVPAAGRAPTAAVPPPTAGPRPIIEGGKFCPGCGASNSPSRTFCSRCGAALEGAAAVTTTEPVPVVKAAPVRRRLPVVPILAVLILVIAVGIVLVTRGGNDTESATSPNSSTTIIETTVAGPTTTAASGPRRIDPATVTALATSTLPDEGPFNYGVKNTLDGNLETAWNDGAAGPGVGEKLTYRFRNPVDVKTIGLVNGFASTPELFKENARIRSMVVITDFARFPITLPDSSARQELNLPFGRTASVQIEVVSVYPGSKYEDLALTEIDFTGVT